MESYNLNKNYAKELFYKKVAEYQNASIGERCRMIFGFRSYIESRYYRTDKDDEYTIAGRWLIRLQSYLNNNIDGKV